MAKNPYSGSKILLVEDEETLAIGLQYNLEEEGYLVQWVKDGREALKKIEQGDFELIILDIMLPYVDGFEIAKIVRQTLPQLPILILTARTGTKDRLLGLEIGADDYVTKPFHLKELMLRVRGMLKRKAWYTKATGAIPYFKFGDNEVNFEKLSAAKGPNEIKLTAYEAMLLQYLIENKGKIVSRKDILKHVWNISTEVETRTVDNFIARLRKYFETDPAHPLFIRSVRGAGYIFEDDA